MIVFSTNHEDSKYTRAEPYLHVGILIASTCTPSTRSAKEPSHEEVHLLPAVPLMSRLQVDVEEDRLITAAPELHHPHRPAVTVDLDATRGEVVVVPERLEHRVGESLRHTEATTPWTPPHELAILGRKAVRPARHRRAGDVIDLLIHHQPHALAFRVQRRREDAERPEGEAVARVRQDLRVHFGKHRRHHRAPCLRAGGAQVSASESTDMRNTVASIQYVRSE